MAAPSRYVMRFPSSAQDAGDPECRAGFLVITQRARMQRRGQTVRGNLGDISLVAGWIA